MKPPPQEIVEAMNEIVNCPALRNLGFIQLLAITQGALSIPDEHYEQMVAAAEHDKAAMSRESHAKIVCLYKAVTASIPAFRAAIRARLIEAGLPAVDMPAWV